MPVKSRCRYVSVQIGNTKGSKAKLTKYCILLIFYFILNNQSLNRALLEKSHELNVNCKKNVFFKLMQADLFMYMLCDTCQL